MNEEQIKGMLTEDYTNMREDMKINGMTNNKEFKDLLNKHLTIASTFIPFSKVTKIYQNVVKNYR